MYSNVPLKPLTCFIRSATHLTGEGLCHNVYTLKMPLYVLFTCGLFVTHTTVIHFVFSHCAHSRDVAVKLSMLQKHCKMRNSEANLILVYYSLSNTKLSRKQSYNKGKIQQFS